jgi:hypothetical protein
MFLKSFGRKEPKSSRTKSKLVFSAALLLRAHYYWEVEDIFTTILSTQWIHFQSSYIHFFDWKYDINFNQFSLLLLNIHTYIFFSLFGCTYLYAFKFFRFLNGLDVNFHFYKPKIMHVLMCVKTLEKNLEAT